MTAVQVVEQSAWRGYHDVRTAVELFALCHHVHSADNHSHAETDWFTHNFKLIRDLKQTSVQGSSLIMLAIKLPDMPVLLLE